MGRVKVNERGKRGGPIIPLPFTVCCLYYLVWMLANGISPLTQKAGEKKEKDFSGLEVKIQVSAFVYHAYLIYSKYMLSAGGISVTGSFVILDKVKLPCVRKTVSAPENNGSIQRCRGKHTIWYLKQKLSSSYKKSKSFWGHSYKCILFCSCLWWWRRWWWIGYLPRNEATWTFYHWIHGILLASSTFGQYQLVMKNLFWFQRWGNILNKF